MVSQKLLDYIKRELEAGLSRADITKALLKIGWTKPGIDEAFTEVRKKPVVPIEVHARKKFVYLVIGIIVIIAVAIALLWLRAPVVPVEEELIFNSSIFGKILENDSFAYVEDKIYLPGETMAFMITFTGYSLREDAYGTDRTAADYWREFEQIVLTEDEEDIIISEMSHSKEFGDAHDEVISEEFGFMDTIDIPLDALGKYTLNITIFDKNSLKKLSRIETIYVTWE